MSDQTPTTTTTEALRPREADALAAWDSLDGDEKTYKNVADMLNITEGRAGVYVRDALNKSGRSNETPRSSGGGGRRKAVAAVNPFIEQLQNLLTQNEQTVERLNEQVNEAKANAADFKPEDAIKEHRQALQDRVKAAQAALDAFKGDATKEWATERQAQLTKQAESIEEQVAEQLTTAQANVEQARTALAAMQTMPTPAA